VRLLAVTLQDLAGGLDQGVEGGLVERLGVLKVNGIDGKSERQLEKVKAYSGEESKKEGNVYCGLETYTYQSERRESPQSHLLSTQLSLHSQADPSARSHTMLPQPTLMERGKRKRCGESA